MNDGLNINSLYNSLQKIAQSPEGQKVLEEIEKSIFGDEAVENTPAVKNETVESAPAVGGGGVEDNSFSLSSLDPSLNDADFTAIEAKQTGNTYTYTSKSGVVLTSKFADVKFFENEETGEVIIADAKDGSVTGEHTAYYGANDITIYNSNLDSLATSMGNDNVEIIGSTVGDIDTNGGADKLTLKDSSYREILTQLKVDNIEVKPGDDVITIDNSTGGNIYTGGGADKVNIQNGSKVADVFTESGNDWVDVKGESSTQSIYLGAGADKVTAQNAQYIDQIKSARTGQDDMQDSGAKQIWLNDSTVGNIDVHGKAATGTADIRLNGIGVQGDISTGNNDDYVNIEGGYVSGTIWTNGGNDTINATGGNIAEVDPGKGKDKGNITSTHGKVHDSWFDGDKFSY